MSNRYATTPTSKLLMLLEGYFQEEGDQGNRYLEIAKELDRRIPVQAHPTVPVEKVKALEWKDLPKPDWGAPAAKCPVCNSVSLSAVVADAERANAEDRIDYIMETIWDLLDKAQRDNHVLDVEASMAYIEAAVERRVAERNLQEKRKP